MQSLQVTGTAVLAPQAGLAHSRTQSLRHIALVPPKTSNRDVKREALPVVPLATAAYAFGAFKLWSGFSRTTFDSEKKTQLAALWPFLFIASESFRANFKRAISE